MANMERGERGGEGRGEEGRIEKTREHGSIVQHKLMYT